MERNGSDAEHDAGGSSDTTDPRFIFGDDDSGSDVGGGGSDGSGASGSDRSDGSAGTAEGKKRRGRPAGSRNKTRKTVGSSASVAASIDGLTRAIHLLHFGLANGIHAATKNENLARVFLLTPEESRAVAEPLAAIQNRYVGEVNGDMQLIMNLGTALIGVYGGKLMGGMMANAKKSATPATA